jgi:hypothetical protein
LDKIGKDGAFHKRLNNSQIMTVEDFLRLVVMDPQRLRNVSIICKFYFSCISSAYWKLKRLLSFTS